MPRIEVELTTIASATKFGVAGYWIEIPDVYPPIYNAYTETTISSVTERRGAFLVQTMHTTASKNVTRYTPIAIAAFQAGTRHVRLGAACNGVGNGRKLVMYYRSVGEIDYCPV